MNRGKKALSLVKRWTKKIGWEEARIRLASTKVIGFTTADKIARGAYGSTPGHDITEALLSELAKDGFFLEDAS